MVEESPFERTYYPTGGEYAEGLQAHGRMAMTQVFTNQLFLEDNGDIKVCGTPPDVIQRDAQGRPDLSYLDNKLRVSSIYEPLLGQMMVLRYFFNGNNLAFFTEWQRALSKVLLVPNNHPLLENWLRTTPETDAYFLKVENEIQLSQQSGNLVLNMLKNPNDPSIQNLFQNLKNSAMEQ